MGQNRAKTGQKGPKLGYKTGFLMKNQTSGEKYFKCEKIKLDFKKTEKTDFAEIIF